MRRWIRLLLSLSVAGLAAWMLAKRVGTGGGREASRLDRGVAAEGERGRIDPHGPLETEPASDLLIDARLEQQTPEELRIEVEIGSGSPFDSVVVRATRFDADDSPAPAWSEVVWTGKVERAATVRFESRVPVGSAVPARVLMRAEATGENGARHTATAILRPGSAEP